VLRCERDENPIPSPQLKKSAANIDEDGNKSSNEDRDEGRDEGRNEGRDEDSPPYPTP
jgi:hypothetical protein